MVVLFLCVCICVCVCSLGREVMRNLVWQLLGSHLLSRQVPASREQSQQSIRRGGYPVENPVAGRIIADIWYNSRE